MICPKCGEKYNSGGQLTHLCHVSSAKDQIYCCERCALNTKGDAYDYDVDCIDPACPCHSPAKDQITSPSLSSSHEGDAESVSGEECGNCHKPHYGKDYCPTLPKYEDQPQLEWEIGFAAMYNRLSVVFSLDELHQVKGFIREVAQKEYERGREERAGEIQATVERQVRNDTLNEAILIIDGEFLYENKGREIRERILKRLKANRDTET